MCLCVRVYMHAFYVYAFSIHYKKQSYMQANVRSHTASIKPIFVQLLLLLQRWTTSCILLYSIHSILLYCITIYWCNLMYVCTYINVYTKIWVWECIWVNECVCACVLRAYINILHMYLTVASECYHYYHNLVYTLSLSLSLCLPFPCNLFSFLP